MLVDAALILAAGLGTRMGDIGKVLPKPLWPLFEATLMDFHICFLKDLGIKKIFINTHHCASEIHQYVNEKHPNITILHERELLDIGGGIMNVKNVGGMREGALFVVNSDMLCLFSSTTLNRACSDLKQHDVVLFPMQVPLDSHYNRLFCDKGRLIEIQPPSLTSSTTYSGFSLVNMEKVEGHGVNKFFTTIADFKSKSVLVADDGPIDQLDFGTLEVYIQSNIELVRRLKKMENTDKLIEKLLGWGIIKKENLIPGTSQYLGECRGPAGSEDGTWSIKEGKISINLGPKRGNSTEGVTWQRRLTP
jgi:NDP-sugar pyrophosphorylase family protein